MVGQWRNILLKFWKIRFFRRHNQAIFKRSSSKHQISASSEPILLIRAHWIRLELVFCFLGSTRSRDGQKAKFACCLLFSGTTHNYAHHETPSTPTSSWRSKNINQISYWYFYSLFMRKKIHEAYDAGDDLVLQKSVSTVTYILWQKMRKVIEVLTRENCHILSAY